MFFRVFRRNTRLDEFEFIDLPSKLREAILSVCILMVLATYVSYWPYQIPNLQVAITHPLNIIV